MTERLEEIYGRAKKDAEFLAAIKSAGGDKPPGIFADRIERIVFAAVYYGWLVARRGDDSTLI